MAFVKVELPDDLAEALGRAAVDMQSTREAVLLKAARSYLADRDALEAAIAEGEADVAAGRVIPHEEVMAEMREWAAELLRRTAAE